MSHMIFATLSKRIASWVACSTEGPVAVMPWPCINNTSRSPMDFNMSAANSLLITVTARG